MKNLYYITNFAVLIYVIYDVIRADVFEETDFSLLHYDANLSWTNITSSTR